MVGKILCCFTCGTSFMLASIVFAISWVLVRPVLGGPILALSVLACCSAIYMRAKHGNTGGKSLQQQLAVEGNNYGAPIISQQPVMAQPATQYAPYQVPQPQYVPQYAPQQP
eukprot:COSAG01_NODE_13467_length_1582_cov_1.240054_2_plen_111_part_01